MDKEGQGSPSSCQARKKDWTNEDLSPSPRNHFLSIVGRKFDYVSIEIDEWRRRIERSSYRYFDQRTT